MSRSRRICTVCGIAYNPGTYEQHRLDTVHQQMLRASAKRVTVDARARANRIKEMTDYGLSYQAIADAEGISRQRVGQIAQRYGFARPRTTPKTCFLCGAPYTKWPSHATDDDHLIAERQLIEGLRR